jgi:hypothetical protein
MSLTVARPGFAARSADFEMKKEGFILIGIRRYDKKQQGTYAVGIEGIIVVVFTVSTACYKDRKLMFRILCGTI